MPLWSQQTLSDSAVEQLMNQTRFRDASRLILKRINNLPKEETDLRLYFYTKLSMTHLRLLNIDSSLIFAQKSLQLSKFSTDSTLIVEVLKTAAYAYNIAGNLDSAMFFTRKILNYASLHHDNIMKRKALTSLATILAQNKLYGDALEYHRKAWQLTQTINDSVNFPIMEYNIGLSFLNLKQTDSSLYYLNHAIDEAKKRNNNELLIYIYGTISDCYLLLKNDTGYTKYLLLANEIAEKIGNMQFLAMGYSSLTQSALENNRFSDAIAFGQKAIDIFKVNPYPILQLKVDSMMYIACKKSGRPLEALQYIESFNKHKEEIVNERQRDKLNDLVIKFDLTEKDLIIANQKLDIAKKQRNQQKLMIAFIFILLVLAGLIAYEIRSRQFRKELFRKEKYLDNQIVEMRDWLQWKQSKDATKTATPGIKDINQDKVSDLSGQKPANKALFAELREIFEQQKLYLDADVNLASVIKILGTNKKYLYEAMSKSSDDNFRNFVNRYRINEAKAIIESKINKGEDLVISELYLQTGFSNTASFYRAFNSITGLTPRQYATEIRKEIRDTRGEK